METASIYQIKNEIKHLEKLELMELCLNLAKFKKENKELLSYLLFQADDEQHFIELIKKDIALDFKSINRSSLYLVKKSVRRILKQAKKYIRYSKKLTTEIEVLLYFCSELGRLSAELEQSVVLANMYHTQVRLIQKCLSKVHEDIQYDYKESFDAVKAHKACS